MVKVYKSITGVTHSAAPVFYIKVNLTKLFVFAKIFDVVYFLEISKQQNTVDLGIKRKYNDWGREIWILKNLLTEL